VRLHRARKLLRAGWAAPLLAALFAFPWSLADMARAILGPRAFALSGGAVAASLWGTMMLGVLVASAGALVATGVVESATVERWLGLGGGGGDETADGVASRAGAETDEAPTSRGRLAAASRAVSADAPMTDEGGIPFVEESFYVSGPIRMRQEMLRLVDGRTARHGTTVTWTVGGERESEGTYVLDEKHGTWTEWYEDGTKLSQGGFAHGLESGPWTLWYEDGLRESAGPYEAGRRHGEWTFWHEDGSVKESGPFEDGLKRGRWTEHYEGGDVMLAGEYAEGEKHGAWKAWNEDGSVAWEAQYEADELHGEYVQHFAGGSTMVTEYRRGQMHGKQTTYFPSGAKSNVTHFVEGKRHGPWVSWHQNGRKLFESAYDRGFVHGRWRAWYPNGTPWFDRTYEKRRPVGTATTWYPSGTKMSVTVHGGSGKPDDVTEWYGDGSLRAKGKQLVSWRRGEWTFALSDGTRLQARYDDYGRPLEGTVLTFRGGNLIEMPDGSTQWEYVPWKLRTYAAGKLHGPAADFHPDGVTRELEWNNVEGLAQGRVTRRDADGKVAGVEIWRDGEKVGEEAAPE
jgi:antitoxin component YwqK of YwqJK toxin-antitoxin module